VVHGEQTADQQPLVLDQRLFSCPDASCPRGSITREMTTDFTDNTDSESSQNGSNARQGKQYKSVPIRVVRG